MTTLFATLLLGLSTAHATAPTKVEFVQASEVEVPAHINRVLFLDYGVARGPSHHQVRATNVAERFALRGNESAAFEVVYVPTYGNPDVPPVESMDLSWEELGDLCNRFDVDGVLTMDMMSFQAMPEQITRQKKTRTNKDGRKVSYFVWTGRRQALTMASWRFFDPRNQLTLDKTLNHRESAERRVTNQDRGRVVNAMANIDNELDDLGTASADWYAARVFSMPISQRRDYYDGGKLKDGHKLAQSGDWAAARDAWLPQMADKGAKGMKASYNVALSLEMAGELEEARRMLDPLLAEGFDKRFVNSYAAELDARIANAAALTAQGVDRASH